MVGRNATVQVQLTSLSLGDNFFLLVSVVSTSSYASSYQIQGCLFSGLLVAVGSWVLNYSWAIKAILAHLTMSFQYPHL